MADDKNKDIGSDRRQSELKKLRAKAKKRQRNSNPPAKTATGKRKKSESREREKCLSIRVTEYEHACFKLYAANSGLKMGAYVRQCILGDAGERAQKQPSVDQKMLAQVLGQVGKVGGNINQLAKRANIDGYGAVAKTDLEQVIKDISAMRAMLMLALRPD